MMMAVTTNMNMLSSDDPTRRESSQNPPAVNRVRLANESSKWSVEECQGRTHVGDRSVDGRIVCTASEVLRLSKPFLELHRNTLVTHRILDGSFC